MKIPFKLFFFALLISLFACSKNEDPVPNPDNFKAELSASPLSLNFSKDGGTETISITSNTTWNISSNASWCTSALQTSKDNANINISAEANTVEEERTATISISAEDVSTITIAVTQEAKEPEIIDPEVPDSIAADMTGMSSNAITLASQIQVGWNMVNTLEATGGETSWGNPMATNELMAAVKNAGFSAVRLPCAWDRYLENQSSYKIKESWFDRVQEVVDYCVDNDLYAILNIHWDGGWMEQNCIPESLEAVNNKLEIIWKQIAIRFRDYDEHLLFAGANEPNADEQENVDVLNVYMQTFVDAVRSTGGRNAYRNLIIQAPNTDIDKADQFMTMPTDRVEDRLLAEVHYYTPWNFCGLEEDASWGKMFYFWGEPNHVEGAGDRNANWGEEDLVESQFKKMKAKLVDNGFPVILGEFGSIYRDLSMYQEGWQEKHNESRAYFMETVARKAKNNGLVPFCWDNGLIDRNSYEIIDSLSYKSLIKGAEDGSYPF
nr:cellulase family glycosylhydrolase [uncultured Draconibacterium sp.]